MTLLINLNKIYVHFNHKIVLSNITLKLTSGKILTLIGPNGAGKSTLVRVVLGIIKPKQGKLNKLKNLKIGYVPQKLYIDKTLPITVGKFIKYFACNKKTDIFSLLKKVKAEHLINYSLNNLSPGEIRRVLLARSILNYPQLLVLDEPTQGIDVNGQIMFYNLINKIRIKTNCGVLMISHDLHLVMAKTDEVICLNKNICCSGTPKIVAQHPQFNLMFGEIYKNKLAFYNHNHKCE